MSQWAGLLRMRGCEKQKAKGCVGRVHDEEQLVKCKVEMLQMFKAFGKAEWCLGHWSRKSKASVLNLISVWMLRAWRLGRRGT